MDEKTTFRTRDAAAFLSISIDSMRKLAQHRVIPSTRPGGKLLYFKKQDLEDYLRQTKKGGTNE